MQNQTGRRSAIAYGVCAAAWLAVLFFFSGQTGTDSGSLSSSVTDLLFGWLIKRGVSFDTLHIITRKLAHFGIFAVEGWLLGSALLRLMKNRLHAFFASGLACALVAVLNELHQLTSDERVCSAADMLIDTCGALMGIAFAAAILFLSHRLKKCRNKQYATTKIYNNR